MGRFSKVDSGAGRAAQRQFLAAVAADLGTAGRRIEALGLVGHDDAMATVWVSTASRAVDADAESPGDHWLRVGVIDTSAQRDFYTHIQQYIGVRKTAKGRPEFYLSGDPDSAWVHQARNQIRERAQDNGGAWPTFWILINPYGPGQIHYSAGSIKYLLGAGRASVVHALRLRAPELHPGLQVEPVTLAIKLTRSGGELFTPYRTRVSQ
ncbi:hypothetical protein [Mycobacteroides abscessus]